MSCVRAVYCGAFLLGRRAWWLCKASATGRLRTAPRVQGPPTRSAGEEESVQEGRGERLRGWSEGGVAVVLLCPCCVMTTEVVLGNEQRRACASRATTLRHPWPGARAPKPALGQGRASSRFRPWPSPTPTSPIQKMGAGASKVQPDSSSSDSVAAGAEKLQVRGRGPRVPRGRVRMK